MILHCPRRNILDDIKQFSLIHLLGMLNSLFNPLISEFCFFIANSKYQKNNKQEKNMLTF
jgi:hypothetical protein